jgi:hypothetical protein
MEQIVRGGIRSATPRHKSRRKPKGCRDECTFWRLERTGAGGVRDARCLWKEPKRALVVAGKMEAAFAVLDITRRHGRVFLSHRVRLPKSALRLADDLRFAVVTKTGRLL